MPCLIVLCISLSGSMTSVAVFTAHIPGPEHRVLSGGHGHCHILISSPREIPGTKDGGQNLKRLSKQFEDVVGVLTQDEVRLNFDSCLKDLVLT